MLHSELTRPSSAVARRLKSRHPFVLAAQQLISFSDNNSICAVGGSSMECGVGRQPHKTLHFNSRHRYTHPRNGPPKESLGPAQPPPHGVGRFLSCLYKCDMTFSAACKCGAEQTIDHVVLHCPIHRSFAFPYLMQF